MQASADSIVSRCDTALSGREVDSQFRLLLREALKDSPLTIDEVAKQLSMGERNLQRILAGKYRLATAVLVDICNIVGIDRCRASVAIEQFGDWKSYFDPTVNIAVDLIKPVVDNINAATLNSLEPLHPKAIYQLSNWIAETVISHQTQLCERREGLEVSRRL